MMTSFHPAAADELREAGLAATLTKPVKQAQLLQCLSGVLGVDAPPNAVAPLPIEPAPEEPLLARGRILVVEDNLVSQRVAVAQLRKLGFRTQVAGNGREALDVLDVPPSTRC